MVPVFVNDMGRGMLPADHELAFARTRAIGVLRRGPRRGRGHAPRLPSRVRSVRDAAVVHLADSRERCRGAAELAASSAGDLEAMFARSPTRTGDCVAVRSRADRASRLGRAPARRGAGPTRGRGRPGSRSDADPIVPTRVYGELRARLDRDAIVIGDGGDFVSYAGKYVDTLRPGCVPRPGAVRVPRARSRVTRSARRVAHPCAPGRRAASATVRSASRSATSTRWRVTART